MAVTLAAVGVLVILSLLMAAAALAALAPRAALLTCIFLAPWEGLVADFGVQVTAYQVFLLALVAVTLVRSLQPGWRPTTIAASAWFGVFLLYSITSSMVMMGFLPDIEKAGGALRNSTARATLQIALYIFAASPVVLIASLGLRGDRLAACGRVFIASCVVLAAIGWIQVAIWYATGANPIRITAISEALGGVEQHSREGAFDFARIAIYRMSSLAGEPRQLGIALVLGMLIIQAYALTVVRPQTVRLLGLWLFLLASTVATYSTSAAGLWLIGSVVILPAAWLFRIPVRRSAGSMGGAAVLVVAALGLAVAAGEARGIPVVDLIAQRTIERIDTDGAVEDFDLAILGYLNEHPRDAVTGVGIGAAHLYAAPYLEPLFATYAESAVFNAKAGYLRFVSEVGLIGFVLFLAWYARLSFAVAHTVRGDPALAALLPIAAVFVATYLASSQIASAFWMVAGVLTASCAPLRVQTPPRVLRPALSAAA